MEQLNMDSYSEGINSQGRIYFDPESCKLRQFKQNNYFHGKLMTAQDFKLQQSYLNEKRHLLNRLIHGVGIVCGLRVIKIVLNCEPWKAEISEGCAIDCCGREIIVSKHFECGIISSPSLDVMKCEKIGLYIRRVDYLIDPVPSPLAPSSDKDSCYNNHMEEQFELFFDSVPEQTEKAKHIDLKAYEDQTCDRNKIGYDYCKNILDNCPECQTMEASGPKILLAVLHWSNNALVVNEYETAKHRKVVFNNEMLYDLLIAEICSRNKPCQLL